MRNPVLVEVLRGNRVESRHCGAVAVADAAGRPVLTLGDADWPFYPRSAIKALQALPLIESGAADRFGLGAEELALACASHSGEPGHVATATGMLQRAGLQPSALRSHARVLSLRRCAAARIVRSIRRRHRRWRGRAKPRPRCTTIVRASTRPFS